MVDRRNRKGPCPFFAPLRDNDVRSREEDRNSSNDGEEREEYQTNAVDDHSRELPIVIHVRVLLVVPYFVGDDTQLLEDTR